MRSVASAVMFFLGLLAVGNGIADTAKQPGNLRDTVHYVAIKDGSGSAVVTEPGYAVTAAHVAQRQPVLWDGKTRVRVVHLDMINDVALLEGNAIQCPCAGRPEATHNDAVIESVGYPFGFDIYRHVGAPEPIRFHTDGTVMWTDSNMVLYHGSVAAGMSGGGVFECGPKRCAFVGLITEAATEGQMGIAVGAEPVAKLLMRIPQKS